MAKDLQRITDAEFDVVAGPYRVGEEHRREKGWFFTGHYDHDGDPYFARSPSWFLRLQFFNLLRIIGLAIAIVVVPVALLLIVAAIGMWLEKTL